MGEKSPGSALGNAQAGAVGSRDHSQTLQVLRRAWDALPSTALPTEPLAQPELLLLQTNDLKTSNDCQEKLRGPSNAR